jgi:hypothetical protein
VSSLLSRFFLFLFLSIVTSIWYFRTIMKHPAIMDIIHEYFVRPCRWIQVWCFYFFTTCLSYQVGVSSSMDPKLWVRNEKQCGCSWIQVELEMSHTLVPFGKEELNEKINFYLSNSRYVSRFSFAILILSLCSEWAVVRANLNQYKWCSLPDQPKSFRKGELTRGQECNHLSNPSSLHELGRSDSSLQMAIIIVWQHDVYL